MLYPLSYGTDVLQKAILPGFGLQRDPGGDGPSRS